MQGPLQNVLRDTLAILDGVLAGRDAELKLQEVGTIVSVSQGIARVRGLPGVQAEELVRCSGDLLGPAYNLEPGEVGVVLLGPGRELKAGSLVHRTGRILDVPVGEPFLGRVVNALGAPLDGRGPVGFDERQPIEQPAPPIMARAPVTQPLQTGIKVIDALLPSAGVSAS